MSFFEVVVEKHPETPIDRDHYRVENVINEVIEVIHNNKKIGNCKPATALIIKYGKADNDTVIMFKLNSHSQSVEFVAGAVYRIVPVQFSETFEVSSVDYDIKTTDKEIKIHCHDKHFRAMYPYQAIFVYPNPFLCLDDGKKNAQILSNYPQSYVKFTVRDIGAKHRYRLFLVGLKTT